LAPGAVVAIALYLCLRGLSNNSYVVPGILAYVPKFVLGGLLLYLGGALIYEWLIQSARRLSPIEYISLLAIALLILQIGFIAGVFIGVIIGCATFAVSASRVNAIKFSFDGSEYRSTLDREPSELAILALHGREIQGMSLQSYLFFGSANRLYQQVKSLFAARPDTRFRHHRRIRRRTLGSCAQPRSAYHHR
jgi:sulfate permease, SulP family